MYTHGTFIGIKYHGKFLRGVKALYLVKKVYLVKKAKYIDIIKTFKKIVTVVSEMKKKILASECRILN